MTGLISVEFKGNIKQWADDIAQRQIPFATAKALTDTTAHIGSFAASQANATMDIRKSWAGKFQQGSLKKTDLPKNAAFASLPANMKAPLDKMQAIVGTSGWQIAEQINSVKTTRRPLKAKQRYIPIRADRTDPKQRPKALFAKKNKGFVIKTKKGHLILFKREGKDIIPMYKIVKEQEIKPQFDFMQMAEIRAPKLFPLFFTRAMQHAIKTARVK